MASGPRVRRIGLARVLLAVVLAAGSALSAFGAERLPRVRVITTGGTIGNTVAGRLSADQLIATVSHPERLAHIETETFSNVPSATLTIEECARLARRITAVFAADPGLDGIVVTSGTDTLEEIAWLLYLTVPDDRPTVLVGAMRRPGTPDSDGPRNLTDAVRVAGSPAARGRGTLVVMHGQVHSAREVRKRHATDLGAFDAPENGHLGTVTKTRLQFTRAVPLAIAPGALSAAVDGPFPRVEVLLTYQGATGDLVGAAVANGARGLVIAAAGAGALTPAQWDAARRVALEGTPVVIASRTGSGAVVRIEARDAMAIFGAGDLAPVKARVLLILALARRMDPQEIAALFERAGAPRDAERSDRAPR